jgi:hypothetical protein
MVPGGKNAGALERHVLDEMGEAAFVVAFVERAGVHDQAHAEVTLGRGVGQDDVMHPIGKRSLPDRSLGGRGRRGLADNTGRPADQGENDGERRTPRRTLKRQNGWGIFGMAIVDRVGTTRRKLIF